MLSKGQIALIDDEDYDRIAKWKWMARPSNYTYYAVRSSEVGGRKVLMRMHRYIMGVTDPVVEVDHRDRNGLNNQRYNLRVATSSQQKGNAKLSNLNTSGFRGVSWNRRRGYWHAQIWINNHHVHLGSFHDKLEAARAYREAAIAYWGEFCPDEILQIP